MLNCYQQLVPDIMYASRNPEDSFTAVAAAASSAPPAASFCISIESERKFMENGVCFAKILKLKHIILYYSYYLFHLFMHDF